VKRLVPWLLLLAVGCNDAAPRTQVMLSIDADPGVRTEATVLRVQVFGGAEGSPPSSFSSRYLRDHEGPRWPFRVAMIPLEPEPPRAWRARIAAVNADGVEVVQTTVRGGYARERTVQVDVLLQDACVGVPCEDQRCVDGACVDPLVDVASAPTLDGGT